MVSTLIRQRVNRVRKVKPLQVTSSLCTTVDIRYMVGIYYNVAGGECENKNNGPELRSRDSLFPPFQATTEAAMHRDNSGIANRTFDDADANPPEAGII